MKRQELRAELSVNMIELEQALSAGLPHAELVKIYRRIKELQYQLIMENIKDDPAVHAEVTG
jgi:hypothetical protein